MSLVTLWFVAMQLEFRNQRPVCDLSTGLLVPKFVAHDLTLA